MQNTIKIYDTTLRDGAYSPGFQLEPNEMLEIARQLERLGVDSISIGDAATLTGEAASLLAQIERCALSVVCRPLAQDIELAKKLLASAAKKRVDIVAPAQSERMRAELQLDADGLCARLSELVAAAKGAFDEIEVTLQIGSRADNPVLLRLAGAAASAGANIVCVEDKTGNCAPTEFFHIVELLVAEVGNKAEVSVCCRNDLGMAAANALSAVKAGAKAVACSVNGIGSRAGRAPLEEVVLGIYNRADYYEAATNINLRQIYRTSRLVAALSGYAIPPFKAIIGDGVLVNPNSPVAPQQIGVIRNNLVLGRHTGIADFAQRVEDLGYALPSERMEQAFSRFQQLAQKKRAVSDRDIEAIAQPLEGSEAGGYRLVNFVINSGSMFPASATVILEFEGQQLIDVSTGSGPVDAAFCAIDNISELELQLEDFSLQSVTEGEDALGSAAVRVRYKDKLFWGRGISTDIVEAAILAYIHALNKAAAYAGE